MSPQPDTALHVVLHWLVGMMGRRGRGGGEGK